MVALAATAVKAVRAVRELTTPAPALVPVVLAAGAGPLIPSY